MLVDGWLNQEGDVHWYDWKTLRLFGPFRVLLIGSAGSLRPALSYPGLRVGRGPGMLMSVLELELDYVQAFANVLNTRGLQPEPSSSNYRHVIGSQPHFKSI